MGIDKIYGGDMQNNLGLFLTKRAFLSPDLEAAFWNRYKQAAGKDIVKACRK